MTLKFNKSDVEGKTAGLVLCLVKFLWTLATMSRQPLESRFTKQNTNIPESPFPKSCMRIFLNSVCLTYYGILGVPWGFRARLFFFGIQGLSPAVELKLVQLHWTAPLKAWNVFWELGEVQDCWWIQLKSDLFTPKKLHTVVACRNSRALTNHCCHWNKVSVQVCEA